MSIKKLVLPLAAGLLLMAAVPAYAGGKGHCGKGGQYNSFSVSIGGGFGLGSYGSYVRSYEPYVPYYGGYVCEPEVRVYSYRTYAPPVVRVESYYGGSYGYSSRHYSGGYSRYGGSYYRGDRCR